MNGSTTPLTHLAASLTLAHDSVDVPPPEDCGDVEMAAGAVGKARTITVTVNETVPARVAVCHMTPDEARDAAQMLNELADHVEGVHVLRAHSDPVPVAAPVAVIVDTKASAIDVVDHEVKPTLVDIPVVDAADGAPVERAG